MMSTSAASRNEDKSGAASTAQPRNIPALRSEASRSGGGTTTRTSAAAMSASLQLLTYQPSTITVGTPLCSSASRCAGSAAASSHHQLVAGASSSAPASSAFGGHSVEIG